MVVSNDSGTQKEKVCGRSTLGELSVELVLVEAWQYFQVRWNAEQLLGVRLVNHADRTRVQLVEALPDQRQNRVQIVEADVRVPVGRLLEIV